MKLEFLIPLRVLIASAIVVLTGVAIFVWSMISMIGACKC